MRRFALLALVALLAGCSSAAPFPSASPTAPTPTVPPSPTPIPSPTVDPMVGQIRDAALATIAAGTVGFDVSTTYVGNLAIKDGTAIRGTGAMSFGSPTRIVVDTDYSALSLGHMRMILDDKRLFLSGSFLGAAVPSGKWLLVDLTSTDPRAVPFLQVTKGQNDSSLVIYDLFGAVPPVEFLASEDVNGVVTDHFRFDLDLELAPDAVPAGVREHMLDAIAALRAAGIERRLEGQAWIGRDGDVQKVMYTFNLGPVLGGGRLEVAYTFHDFGQPLDLGIPKASSTVRLEDLKR